MNAESPAKVGLESFIQRLAKTADESSRRRILLKDPQFLSATTVQLLYEEIARRARADLAEAEHLTKAAVWLAARLKDNLSRAYSFRATGHMDFMRGRQESALRKYKKALALFDREGRELDVARTLSGALQTLIYLGQYDKAFAWAQRARKIFENKGDQLRLARLDTNLGNVLYRQDRFEEALEHYQRSEKVLRRLGDPQDVAAALSNIAVCHISLNDFQKALYAYQKARSYCQTHNLPLFGAQADYNIAYLYYLRGEYTRAIEQYEVARKQAEQLSDPYHKTLCDLDQAEMYLELNLADQGGQLARRAVKSFEKLKMGYEAAKALAFLAIASSQQGEISHALQLFSLARSRFVREKNRVWPALIDLYQALVLYQDERYGPAQKLCQSALRFFLKTSLTTKAVLCELLLARLRLQAGDPSAARKRTRSALHRLDRVDSLTLRYHASFVRGQVEEALGHPERAFEAYEEGHAALESLRSSLSGEELKISFLKDKLAVYEGLVWLSTAGRPLRSDFQTAFAYIEFAKSRSLADLIAFRSHTLPGRSTEGNSVVDRVHHLREQLTRCYRQLDALEMSQQSDTGDRLRRLREQTVRTEKDLIDALGEARATEREFTSLQNAGTIPLDTICSALPNDALLLEYYVARGTLFACLVGRETLDIVRLGDASRSRSLLQLLQFQLSKFRLGPEYVRSSQEMLLQATQAHLRELYDALLAPVRHKLHGKHLVIVPHDFLHCLPFHALFDGENYLMDHYSVTYAPSASVYFLCQTKSIQENSESLVLGIPDPQVPHILEEVREVAKTLSRSHLFVGAEANEKNLQAYGSRSRFVHIATHGLFRQDNPMFSSLRLGNSQLTLFDLYNLRLPAELVTLSGCGTGLNVVVGGDEILGLVRGLLYAGAKALLVTLWDVNDRSTTDFMKSFYRHLQMQPNKGRAVQNAMQELRQTYPHPYYWAPFCLVGAGLSGEACGDTAPYV